MCIGARSGSNPGPLGSEPSALTNCAGCPLASIVYRGLKRDVTSCTMYLPVCVMYVDIFTKLYRACNVQPTYIQNDYVINMYILCIYMIMHMCSCIYTFILYIYMYASCSYMVSTDPNNVIHGIYSSKHVCQVFHEIKKTVYLQNSNQWPCAY